jgi:hypothetical protein
MDCGLRFSATYAAVSRTCPMCCGPLRFDVSAAEVLGQQLYFEAPADPFIIFRPPRDGR